jgi:uncharacterized protein involved in exopolysaccharide biosynthesis
MGKISSKNSLDQALPEVSLRDVMAPLFRHKRAVLITFCTVFALALVVAWGWAARYYVADMQIAVEQERTDPAISAGQIAAINGKGVSNDEVVSEMALLQGRDMLQKAAATCGLADEKHWSISSILLPRDPVRRRAMKEESAARDLLKKIKVEATPASHLIDVHYGSTEDAETPACVLQTLSKLYLEKHLQLNRPAGTTDFFERETEKYRKALADSETRLTGFSEKEGVAAPEALRGFMAQQVATSIAALHQAEEASAADQKRIATIKSQMETTPARSATVQSSNAANLLLQQLQASLLAAEIKKTQLLTKFDPSYPLVKEADQEIEQTKAAIARAEEAKYVNQATDRDATYEYLRQDNAKALVDLASQQATAGALRNSIRSMQLELVKLDSQSVQQSALVREAKANEANYLLYLNKREQERTSDALDQKRIANVAISVPPVIPALPAHNPIKVMLIGLLGAIFAGIAAAFVMEYFDASFRTPSEVADTLNIPVLATMPRRAA